MELGKPKVIRVSNLSIVSKTHSDFSCYSKPDNYGSNRVHGGAFGQQIAPASQIVELQCICKILSSRFALPELGMRAIGVLLLLSYDEHIRNRPLVNLSLCFT